MPLISHSSDASRESFRKLLNNGQIEFISGGYVMNDEAATYYTNTIDQMTLGLGILKSEFMNRTEIRKMIRCYARLPENPRWIRNNTAFPS